MEDRLVDSRLPGPAVTDDTQHEWQIREVGEDDSEDEAYDWTVGESAPPPRKLDGLLEAIVLDPEGCQDDDDLTPLPDGLTSEAQVSVGGSDLAP